LIAINANILHSIHLAAHTFDINDLEASCQEIVKVLCSLVENLLYINK